MIRNASLVLVGLLSILSVSPTTAQQAPAGAEPDRATLEKNFAETMNNSRLTGFYTVEGQQGPPQQDQYTLQKVQKAEGDKWLFIAHIEYGKKMVNLPLEIPVLWAGDTPVISVTDFTIPGMGTYTARVMIHGDHYAGTWSAGPDHNGYLWGRIEHSPPKALQKNEKPSKE